MTPDQLINDLKRRSLSLSAMWDLLGEHIPNVAERRRVLAAIQKLKSDTLDRESKRKRLAAIAAQDGREQKLREVAAAHRAMLDAVSDDFTPPKRKIDFE